MARQGAVFATALIVGFFSWATPLAAQPPGSLAFSPAISSQIDRLGIDEVHSGRTPGIAIGIVEDGRLVYARGFGFATVVPHTSMTPDTDFYAGGLTTEFTAAAILLLAQDGKLKLDDAVSKYVPQFRSAANVTIAQLLTQTSGLPQYVPAAGSSVDFTHPENDAVLFAAIDKMKPAAPPGAVYANNPLNYFLAGRVVERASGVTLSDYLEQHIFIPLIMNSTFLAGDSGISPARATGYTRTGNQFGTTQPWDPSWLAGEAGLVSTINDLAKWDIEMPVLLRVDAMRTIFTPGVSAGQTHYGMGWVVDRRDGKPFDWTNGEIAGYRATNALLPDQHIGVIVFSNADSFHGGSTIPEEVAARILDVLVPPTTVRLDNAIVTKAKDWLARLASGRIDRSELTPSFSALLTDKLVARENFASLGRLQVIVPLSSTTESNGNTLYEFLVRYPHVQYHYDFVLTPDGKIDGITLFA